jgi:hypothetical protein
MAGKGYERGVCVIVKRVLSNGTCNAIILRENVRFPVAGHICLCVSISVCLLPLFLPITLKETAIPKGSALHLVDVIILLVVLLPHGKHSAKLQGAMIILKEPRPWSGSTHVYTYAPVFLVHYFSLGVTTTTQWEHSQ